MRNILLRQTRKAQPEHNTLFMHYELDSLHEGLIDDP